jgi:excisionase family DNA binding protein
VTINMDDVNKLLAATQEGSTLFLTPGEMATLTRLSRMTIYRFIHDGDIEAVRMGRSLRIPTENAMQFLKAAGFMDAIKANP